jgi:hypothetical protein
MALEKAVTLFSANRLYEQVPARASKTNLCEQILDIEVCFCRSDDVSQIQLVGEIPNSVFLKFSIFFVRFIRRNNYRPVSFLKK